MYSAVDSSPNSFIPSAMRAVNLLNRRSSFEKRTDIIRLQMTLLMDTLSKELMSVAAPLVACRFVSRSFTSSYNSYKQISFCFSLVKHYFFNGND